MSEKYKLISAIIDGDKSYFQGFVFSETDNEDEVNGKIYWNKDIKAARVMTTQQAQYLMKEFAEMIADQVAEITEEDLPEGVGFILPVLVMDESFLDIDSAPRDGTLIVIASEDVGEREMRWVAEAATLVGEDGQHYRVDGAWVGKNEEDAWIDVGGEGPTHWKPLRKNFN